MLFTIRINGTGALLMHNGQLSDPLNRFAKALKPYSAKRKKTDEDHENLGRLEFLGSLYHDEDAGPFIPGDNVWRCLYDASKKTTQGPVFKTAVQITTLVNPLAYSGPRGKEELWANKNFVFRHTAKNPGQSARIVRTRPTFQEWALEADGALDENDLNFADLQAIADRAGGLIGLGDWRPKFGRFTATVEAR
jgi:hypothetical protein